MKNIKAILGIVVMTLFLFNTASAQDGKIAEEKKEKIIIKAPKKVKKESSETIEVITPTKKDDGNSGETKEDWDMTQSDNNADLKKYKKSKKVKKKKRGKKNKAPAIQEKSDAHQALKEKMKTEDKVERSDAHQALKEKMKMEGKVEKSDKKTTIHVKAAPDVAPTSTPIKSNKEQIAELEDKIARMKNIVDTKDLSEDAQRKYGERISAMEKDLEILQPKVESETE